MFDKLKSRKFWFALLGALLPILAQVLTGEVGWEMALQLSAAVVASYIFGQAYVDASDASATPVMVTEEPVLDEPTAP